MTAFQEWVDEHTAPADDTEKSATEATDTARSGPADPFSHGYGTDEWALDPDNFNDILGIVHKLAWLFG